MTILRDQHRALGTTGLTVPPIVFGAAALGNVGRVTTDQAKLAICGEWFRLVAPPVVIRVAYADGDGMSLEILVRMLRRLEVASEEVVIELVVGAAGVLPDWEKSCRLLGDDYRPKLISVPDGDDDARQAANELKAAGDVQGVGVVVSDLVQIERRAAAIDCDWVTLAAGCTLMRHSPEVIAFMQDLATRHIPIVLSGVFDGGFLVGGNRLDGRPLSVDDPANRSWLSWRKAFVALCDGHGISPAHACIQFALAAPGVVAVRLESSYADRVAENVAAVCTKVPENFWQSMREEGLLPEDDPVIGS